MQTIQCGEERSAPAFSINVLAVTLLSTPDFRIKALARCAMLHRVEEIMRPRREDKVMRQST